MQCKLSSPRAEGGTAATDRWQLLHEMAVDPNFRFCGQSSVAATQSSPLSRLVQRAAKRERQNTLIRALRELLGTGEICEASRESISATIHSLLTRLSQLRQFNISMGGKADGGGVCWEPTLLVQMIEKGAFGHAQLVSLIQSFMAELCQCSLAYRAEQWTGWMNLALVAIERCEHVDERASELGAFVDGLYDRLEQAKHDTANMRFALQRETFRSQVGCRVE